MILYGLVIGGFSFYWRDIIMPACGMFFLMGQMIISARSKKKDCNEDICHDREEGKYRIMANLATSSIMWSLLFVLIIVIAALRTDTIMK